MKAQQNLFSRQVLKDLCYKIGIDQSLRGSPDGQMKWQTISFKDAITITVREQKQFIFDSNRNEWLWFKNLVIPQIDMAFSSAGAPEEDANKPYAGQIFCIKMLENHNIEDVYFSGESYQKLRNCKCRFNGIKFGETTFISRSLHFYLAVLLMDGPKRQALIQKPDSQQLDEPENNVIGMAISPPIYVEAKKKCWLRRKSMQTLFDPFPIDLLDKILERAGKEKGQKLILRDDLESLMHYVNNPYIRHKVLHPLFLLFRFSKAIKLYYNSNIILDHVQTLPEIIISIQKEIREQLIKYSNNNEDIMPQNKPLLLCLQISADDKSQKNTVDKIGQYLSVLNGPVLTFSKYLPFHLPVYFKELAFTDTLKQIYRINYQNIIKFKMEDIQQPSIKEETNNNNMLSNFNLDFPPGQEEQPLMVQKEVKQSVTSLDNLLKVEEETKIQDLTGSGSNENQGLGHQHFFQPPFSSQGLVPQLAQQPSLQSLHISSQAQLQNIASQQKKRTFQNASQSWMQQDQPQSMTSFELQTILDLKCHDSGDRKKREGIKVSNSRCTTQNNLNTMHTFHNINTMTELESVDDLNRIPSTHQLQYPMPNPQFGQILNHQPAQVMQLAPYQTIHYIPQIQYIPIQSNTYPPVYPQPQFQSQFPSSNKCWCCNQGHGSQNQM